MPDPKRITSRDADDDDQPKKRFRIQRRRLGLIKYIHTDGEYGFIEAEDFRDDVFFHRSAWEGTRDSKPQQEQQASELPRRLVEAANRRNELPPRGGDALPESLVEGFVEYEIDDEYFSTEQKLRATVVRLTDRPRGRKLSGRDATFRIVTHHKNARRKRPTWRDK